MTLKRFPVFIFIMGLIKCNYMSNHNLNLQRNYFKNGDIIFQTSLSSQSKALQIVTESKKYTHMGIIYKQNGKYFVYEAVGPVKLTPLKSWIERGKNNGYVVKRLINRDKILTPNLLNNMRKVGEKYRGKSYDNKFEWSDYRIYCSELVWKIYQEGANIKIGELPRFRDFDLSNPTVKKIIEKRWKEELPLAEKVITPISIFNDEKLITVQNEM